MSEWADPAGVPMLKVFCGLSRGGKGICSRKVGSVVGHRSHGPILHGMSGGEVKGAAMQVHLRLAPNHLQVVLLCSRCGPRSANAETLRLAAEDRGTSGLSLS